MKSLTELQNSYYEEFKGLPGYCPIVRNDQPNDAFELVVLKVLYGKQMPEFTKSNVTTFAKYVIAPPDNGIDIFFQHESGDESSFDVIQVKNTELDESEVKNCILIMKRTIDDYCKNPRSIKSESCKEVLSNSNLDKTNKNRCTFYVVHTGTVDDFSGSEENEKVITIKSLDIIYKNISDYVEKDTLSLNTYMKYGNPDDNNGAIVGSLNGLDLAELCNTYYSTEVGRNILFGSNLRESLITKKSKPYLSMSKTITECPENFWYYNNGITIIARDILYEEDNRIDLRGFSIVNGAQTTSALGLFLKESKKNSEQANIEQLKKVFILTRILKVPDERMRQDIAIFNNTQNPITSRDMVSKRPEQEHLHEWLLDDTYPQIYAEIRRGSQIPASFNRTVTHRKTTNEELAQLMYASFLQKPFTAKDKKSALFNNDYTQSEYVINKIYHDVFNWDENDSSKNGAIFKRTKVEIDELLFVQQLYKEAKHVYKDILMKRVETAQKQKEEATTPDEVQTAEDRIKTYSLYLDTIGICMFYFIALYYEFKETMQADVGKIYNYDQIYSDKELRKQLVKEAADLFLVYTVDILVSTATDAGKSGNVNNWVRSAGCESAFFTKLRNRMASDIQLETKYTAYCDKYKIPYSD